MTRATATLAISCIAALGCGTSPDDAMPSDAGTDGARDMAIREEWAKWLRYAEEHCPDTLPLTRLTGFDHPEDNAGWRYLLVTEFRDEGRMRVVIVGQGNVDPPRPWVGEAWPHRGREDDEDPFIGRSHVEVCQKPELDWADCMNGVMTISAWEPRRPRAAMSVTLDVSSRSGRLTDWGAGIYPCIPYTDP